MARRVRFLAYAIATASAFLSANTNLFIPNHGQAAYAQAQGGGNGGNGNGGGNGNAGSNGNGNAGGNGGGNGNGNAGGNAGGNGVGNGGVNGSPPSQSASPVAVSQQTFATSADQVVKLGRAVKDALQLAEKTQDVLKLALINSESSDAYLKKFERLLRRSPHDAKLLGQFKALQGQLDNADEALALAYRNHLKALTLLQGKRRLRDVAIRRHQRLIVKRK